MSHPYYAQHAHHAYQHAPYYAHHASSWGGGLGHMIMHGIVMAAIYHMISPLFRGHGLLGSLAIGILLILAVVAVRKVMSRRAAY